MIALMLSRFFSVLQENSLTVAGHDSPLPIQFITSFIHKSRRMRWAGHLWGKRDVHTRFWWGDLREGDNLGDPGVDGRISKWIFKKWVGGMDWIKLA
jgi:hypothetical protein